MKKIISLSSGCSATYPSVIPKNWKTAGKDSLLKDWTIYYYFEDPLHKKQYPKGKRIRTKGMNEFKTLGERREATEILLQGIVDKLVNNHWNPISKNYMQNNDAIDGNKSLLDSLKYYSKIKKASKSYRENIKSMIGFVEVSIYALQLQYKSVNTVTRKDIKAILRHQQETRDISNYRYNKIKSQMSSLFVEMVEDEVIEHNPTYGIKKLIVDSRLREILTEEDRKRIHYHLKSNFYTFWRFMMIFYSSGARITEILQVQVKDVNLSKLEYKVFIKKGQLHKEVIKPINKNFFYLWAEVINEQNTNSIEANPNHYIFSRGLSKGEKSIRYEQITRRWRVHVKEKLGITADFYSLKHLYSDKISEQLDIAHAQKLNSHTSDRMMKEHYAVNEKQRTINRLKNVDASFYDGNQSD
ncbi:tyrosine-type recombinase/integrase [Tenacibaculum ovolyticum]|uniref:tyrosine-type recombinase/integrase n=1 Tax=Tenacibaculum ovolyticum TaxID=104270 RepID=UPI0003F74440|nr:tyrosine-type recombinase/integrase [Tenacibaculum ovolyticum]